MKWVREIRVIGFKNWVWFVVGKGRDEFHPSLNIGHYLVKYKNDINLGQFYCARDRDRAHRLDMKLKDMK